MTLDRKADAELVAEIDRMLGAIEGERLEFKSAKAAFSFDELAKYCCALANEGGGKILLGVTDRRPREVVGTAAFPQPEDTRRSIVEQLHHAVDVTEIAHPEGRVLVFEPRPRPLGMPVKFKGIYWAREADSLVSMPEERLRRVFDESGHDFSADICAGATPEDLSPDAIEDFRRRWMAKPGNAAVAELSREQLLRDTELLTDSGLTYAALVLFGTRKALGKYLARSEVVFEYRSSEAPGPAQQREEYREGFFRFYDRLWDVINLRNDKQHYQDGLFILDIPTFAERSVREAILNAVSHRDYRLGGSVFVRQYARRLEVDSPGGFPHGITVENILDRQSPRNRLIAETLARCGLVERAGQGMDRMFEESIRQGKALPDFTGSDDYFVKLTLQGEVLDPRFVRYLEKVSQETGVRFHIHDFLALDRVHRGEPVPSPLRSRLGRLADLGIVETIGIGSGTRYLLSRRFYESIGASGDYTRRRGLDREESKALLVRHLKACGEEGCPLSELQQVLPGQSRTHIKRLLEELRRDGLVRLSGARRGARWIASTED